MRALAPLLVLLAIPLGAQQPHPGPPHVIPYLVVAPQVRDSLARTWDETNPQQLERGYCAAWHAAITPERVALIYVDSLIKPDTVLMASGYAVSFHCPRMTVPLHVHTPVTCREDAAVRSVLFSGCAIGGMDAYECFGSLADVQSLEANGFLFGVIQCDRHSFILFSPRPPEYRKMPLSIGYTILILGAR